MSEIAFFPGSTAFALLLAMSLALAGCLPSTAEGPDRLITVSDETSAIRQMLAGPPDLSNTTEDYRNRYITARMYTIDLAYYQYEASLTREHQDTNFAADVINIGLTSSIPLVSSTATKDILGAAASGLTGVKNSYNEDILLTKTIQILQSQMRSNRAQVSTLILTNLKRRPADYPLTVALSNLEDYYRAGTISGALLSVSTAISQDAANAEVDKAAAIAKASIILDPQLPLARPLRGEPAAISGDSRLNATETMLTVGQIKNFQRLVCVTVDGKLGPRGSATRTKIKAFLVDKQIKPTTEGDILTMNDRASLADAIERGEKPACR